MTKWQRLKSKISSVYLAHPFKIVFIILGVVFFTYYILRVHKPNTNFTEVWINGNVVYTQIADTENERSLGLSFTKSLEPNAGLLFIFDKIGTKNFWMRDMNYNIDIIWVDENKVVTGFFENADKDSYYAPVPEYSKIYKSPNNTKYVLEMATNSVENLNIKVGDILDFKY